MLNFQCVFDTILYVLQNLSHLILLEFLRFIIYRQAHWDVKTWYSSSHSRIRIWIWIRMTVKSRFSLFHDDGKSVGTFLNHSVKQTQSCPSTQVLEPSLSSPSHSHSRHNWQYCFLIYLPLSWAEVCLLKLHKLIF